MSDKADLNMKMKQAIYALTAIKVLSEDNIRGKQLKSILKIIEKMERPALLYIMADETAEAVAHSAFLHGQADKLRQVVKSYLMDDAINILHDTFKNILEETLVLLLEEE